VGSAKLQQKYPRPRPTQLVDGDRCFVETVQIVVKRVADDDHCAQRPFLSLFHGLREHVSNMNVAAAVASSPIHDSRHVVGVGDPTCRNVAAAHPGVVVAGVKGELHLQAAGCCCLEHRTLQCLGAVPAGGLGMVGEREDGARGAQHSLLAGFTEHAP
jgi:hypothetical protein